MRVVEASYPDTRYHPGLTPTLAPRRNLWWHIVAVHLGLAARHEACHEAHAKDANFIEDETGVGAAPSLLGEARERSSGAHTAAAREERPRPEDPAGAPQEAT